MKKQSPPQSSASKTSIDLAERAIVKKLCEEDHLFFARYFFKHREGIKFRVNWHHSLIADAVELVIQGEAKNVIINVSPGSSKTELVVINLIARGLALNPRARFLHISYSDDLALLNSQKAREVVQSDEYQELWPLDIADDAKAKKRWNVKVDGKTGGGVYAVSLGGQITGFRAGHMAEGWQGAIIIDDPLKVKGATSKVQRDEANKTLVNTVKSRKANPDTPIIVIMQRLAEDDPTGFIKGGGFPGEWKFIEIPALIDDAYVEALPDHVRDQVEIGERDEDGKFSYWPYKEPLDDLLAMKNAKDSSTRYVFAGQYMQRPTPEGGDIIKGEWFGRYRVLPEIKYRKIYADTAQKTKERNDYSVFECWGLGVDGRIYLLDLLRGKWEAPELERKAIDFWNKHKPATRAQIGALRKLMIEDKASGTGLIQSIRKKGGIPVDGIERHIDKLVRVNDVAGYIESGLVMIPEEAPWASEFIAECEAFTPDDTHAHDDQIDPMCDAINDMLANGKSIYDSL
jgi:predicted phage terminase large subunit-like protein